MFGVGDKVLAMIGAGTSIALGITLAVVLIQKDGLHDQIHDPKTGYIKRLEVAKGDLTRCQSNRITLEEAERRQGEAIKKAEAKGIERIAALRREMGRGEKQIIEVEKEVERILRIEPTGEPCEAADQIILGEA